MPTKLANLRNARGLSLDQLAKLLDPPTTAQQISRLESGERKLATKWVLRLASALGVSPYDVYEDSDMIVSVKEREMIDSLRLLPESQQEAIFQTITNLAASTGPGLVENAPDEPGDEDDAG